MLFNKDKLDSVRVVLALLAAVLSGGGALYGVYLKARSESRIETAASYETLAPEINELKRAVEALEEEKRGAPQRVATRRPKAGQTAPPADGDAPAPPASPPLPAPGPRDPRTEPPGEGAETPDVFEKIRDRVPIDFKKAEEIYREIRKERQQQPPSAP